MFIRLSILSIWRVVDPIYYFMTRLQYVKTNDNKKAIFRVRLTKFKGNDVVLSDGTIIHKNDMLLKIHLHNVQLLKEMLKKEKHPLREIAIYKLVMSSMPFLAKYVKNHAEEQNIKGIVGITMINKGVKKLGFDSVFPKNPIYRWFKKISQLPIYMLSNSPFSIFKISKYQPVYLLMSKEKLLDKYDPNP
ncbi:hypothetical protein J2S08_001302 [Bacillus chungangensis]|uniref:YkoP-like domain-containing protein n=1 Tax=Bacillus chungangensis TaxID=587633 RepID=A0ABT9WQA5_9BACI|nr:hypothetical protein [Bacillus chungangensis]